VEDLEADQLRYSLLLSDTVKVGKHSAAVLTDGCTKLKDVVMELEVSMDMMLSRQS